MERNGYTITNDIVSNTKATRKKNPMSIFLINPHSKTSNKNKSQHKVNEVSKRKTGNRKGDGKR
jgi:hypothetical protein